MFNFFLYIKIWSKFYEPPWGVDFPFALSLGLIPNRLAISITAVDSRLFNVTPLRFSPGPEPIAGPEGKGGGGGGGGMLPGGGGGGGGPGGRGAEEAPGRKNKIILADKSCILLFNNNNNLPFCSSNYQKNKEKSS